MMTFSRFLTLGPAWALWRREIDHALHRIFGKPPEIAPIPVWGRGASHAFSYDNETLSTSAIAGDPSLELILLAGSGADKFVNQERARHLAEQGFADNQTSASVRLAKWRTEPTERRRRFRVQALADFQADIIPALIAADISPEEFSALGDRGLEELVEAIPTIWALTELRRVRFANPEHRFALHDLNDLRALASALVYCDIVVTDKAWCDAVRRTGLRKQLGTVVLNDVAKVEATVRRLTESEAD